MKKFIPWLLPIVLLLSSVPVLLIYNVSTPARITGVILVVLVSVAIRFWLYNASKLKKGNGRVRITINERHTLKEYYSGYEQLPASTRKSLEERMGLLLAELSFDKYDHSEVSREECLLVVLVFALLFKKEEYRSAINKIVVLSENSDKKLLYQEGHPVLFISEDELKHHLKSFLQNSNNENSSDQTSVLLGEFYHF